MILLASPSILLSTGSSSQPFSSLTVKMIISHAFFLMSLVSELLTLKVSSSDEFKQIDFTSD